MSDTDAHTLPGNENQPLSGSPTFEPLTPPEESRIKRILSRIGWITFTIVCLVFFTLIKLPEHKIKNFVDGTIASYLLDKNILYTSGQGRVSFLFGIRYKITDITLAPPGPAKKIHIDEVEISPSIIPYLFGKYAGEFHLKNAGGYLDSSFSLKKSNSIFSVKFDAEKLDLGKLGLLYLLNKSSGSGIIDGNGELSGDYLVPKTLEGDLSLNLAKLSLEPQTYAGFTIPKISISEGNVALNVESGKVLIKSFQLGKPGNADDAIQSKVTGSITLGRDWPSSALGLQARFSLSQPILKAFFLLDALLGAGKQSDGSYAFKIDGTVLSPSPSPITPNPK